MAESIKPTPDPGARYGFAGVGEATAGVLAPAVEGGVFFAGVDATAGLAADEAPGVAAGGAAAAGVFAFDEGAGVFLLGVGTAAGLAAGAGDPLA